MSNAFSGRAIPFLVQGSRLWLKTPSLSGIAAISFSIWGCPGFLRGQPELTGWAALVALVVNVLNMRIIPGIIPAFFTEDKWRIHKELIYNTYIVLSCLILTGFSPLISGKSFPITDQWYNAVIPGAWGLTVCMTILYQVISFRKKNLHAQRIQSGIRKRNRLAGDKDREFSLQVNIQGKETSASAYDIIYLQHAGQQTIIGFRKNTGEVMEGVCSRNFKAVRESVRKLSNFYRCHRDWVVNTDKVTGVIADATGFLLQTEMEGILIPVSSSLNDDLDDRLMK